MGKHQKEKGIASVIIKISFEFSSEYKNMCVCNYNIKNWCEKIQNFQTVFIPAVPLVFFLFF